MKKIFLVIIFILVLCQSVFAYNAVVRIGASDFRGPVYGAIKLVDYNMTISETSDFSVINDITGYFAMGQGSTHDSNLINLNSGTRYYIKINASGICTSNINPDLCWGGCIPTPANNFHYSGLGTGESCDLARGRADNPVAPTTNTTGPLILGGDGSISFVAP